MKPSDNEIEMLAAGFAIQHKNGIIRFAHALLDKYAPQASAGEAQPVAWRYQTPTGWHATTDAQKAVSLRAHHPVEPLYPKPQASAEGVRNAALEQAAAICDSVDNHANPMTPEIALTLSAPSRPRRTRTAPPMADIRLDSPWQDLLPKSAPASERRHRWATWLRLARPVIGRAVRDWAGPQERCCDCSNSRGGWCVPQSLPCSFNPYLTPRTGMVGMACMGMGFIPRQLSLLLPDTDKERV